MRNILGTIVLGLIAVGLIIGLVFGVMIGVRVVRNMDTPSVAQQPTQPVEDTSKEVVPPLSSQNLACEKAFTERGASSDLAKEICAETGTGFATRMTANETCEGWGTVTFDNEDTVWVQKNFSLDGKKAFYAYCYPNGGDIRNAPFFVGAELSPVTGQPFEVSFEKDW